MFRLASLTVLSFAVTGMVLPGVAYSQGHGHGGATLTGGEILGGVSHSVVLASMVFLVGLAAFAALVWLPVSGMSGAGREGARLFGYWGWRLFGLLAVAGAVELSVYAVGASGESFGPGLFVEALFSTRVGSVWMIRLVLALLVALLAMWAVKQGKAYAWWIAAGLGSVLLLTITQLSHAAAEGRFLPFLADWLHVIAATFWMGGLLGFPILLFGPLRTMPPETRAKLLGRAVRRFTGVASVAVVVLVVTGSYAALTHIPGFQELIGTPYGRALIMKLGLVAFMLPIGAMNLLDKGRDPFSSMVVLELILAFGVFAATGFLSSLPPP